MQHWSSKLTIVVQFLGCLFALILAITPTLAQAGTPTTIYECHNCSVGSMQTVARSVVAKKYPYPRPGNGDYATIYDLGNNRIATYWVGWYQAAPGIGGDPPRHRWYVTTVETPTDVDDAFSGLHNIYVGNGNSLILSFDEESLSETTAVAQSAVSFFQSATSGDGGGCWELIGSKNAYDAAVSSAVRNEIRDKLTQQWEDKSLYGEHVWDIMEVVQLSIGVGSSYEVPFIMDYRFLDGGSIAFRYNWNTNHLEHISKTIEDCERNTVPENKEDFDGAQFTFGGGYNLNNFTDFVHDLGGYVTVSGTGGGGYICNGGVDSAGRVYAVCVKQK